MLQRSMSDPTDQQLLAINVEQCNGALINMANELQTLKDRNKGVWEKYFSKGKISRALRFLQLLGKLCFVRVRRLSEFNTFSTVTFLRHFSKL